jgi:peptide/nickel transport system permease protein
MPTYIAKRLLAAIPVIFGLSIIVFLVMKLIPGDPAQALLGSYATPDNVARINRALGLDRSWPEQYVIWIGNIAQGDFGRSYVLNRPVLDEVLERFGATLILAGASLVICSILGILAGIVSAVRQFGWTDRIVTFFVLIGISMPAFFLGLVFILFFAVQWRLLPASGMYAVYGGGDLPDLLRHLILPASTLAIVATGVVARLTRAAMLEVLRQDFIRTARAKGLSEKQGHLSPCLPRRFGVHHSGARHPGRVRPRRRRLYRNRVPMARPRPDAGESRLHPRYPAGAGRGAHRRQRLCAGQSSGRCRPGHARPEAQGMSDLPMTAPPPARKRRSNVQLLLNNRLAAAGLFIFGFIVIIALLAPLLPLPNPDITDQPNRLLPPLSAGHLLGTDHLGRDILSRLIWGTQVSLLVGISATALAALFGSLIGLVAGYARGATDSVLMRFVDMLMAFPYILLAIAIVAALGPGLLNALYAIALVNIPFFARNIRGVTVSIRNREFVDAARLSGKSHAAILFTEVLPNVLPVIVITMSTTVGWMILETAGLSFLGLGAQPPTADLGSMLGQARAQLFTAPHASIIPGIMIFVLVMSINLLGDGIRDVLDPRLRSGALDRPMAVTKIDRETKPAATLANAPALVIENLSTGFDSGEAIIPAVRDISFRLGKGECLGLIGESGSGKSVTALSLMGLVASPPGVITNGAAYVDGKDTFSLREQELIGLRGARVAYVFQDPLTTLHPLFAVGDQIAEAILAHKPLGRQAARAPRRRTDGDCRHPRCCRPRRRLSARTFRRPAPAHRHRHGPWPTIPTSSSPMNPPPRSTSPCRRAFSSSCRTSAASAVSPSCSSPMISASSPRSATGSQ